MAALRSFLGLTSWFRKFLSNYATVVEPLQQLLRTNTQAELEWTDVADKSFTKLKTMLLKSPVLTIYDPKLPTFITTDASDYGLGAVLTQLHTERAERVVAFASRTLSPAERKYQRSNIWLSTLWVRLDVEPIVSNTQTPREVPDPPKSLLVLKSPALAFPCGKGRNTVQ